MNKVEIKGSVWFEGEWYVFGSVIQSAIPLSQQALAGKVGAIRRGADAGQYPGARRHFTTRQTSEDSAPYVAACYNQNFLDALAPYIGKTLTIIRPGGLLDRVASMPPLEGPPRVPTAALVAQPNPARVTCTIGPVSVGDVLVEAGEVWLTRKQMAALFEVEPQAIDYHADRVKGLTRPGATSKKFLVVRTEGTREVQRHVEHYNTRFICTVGYGVNGERGEQFRDWCTALIHGEVEAPAPKAALTRMPNGDDVMRLVSIVETLSSKVEELSSKQLPASAYESIVESAIADRFDTLESRLAKLETPKTPAALPPLTLVRPQTKPRFADWFSAQAGKRGVLRKDCGKLFQRVYAQLAAEYDFDVYRMRQGSETLWSVALTNGYEDELFECAETVLKGLDRADAAE